MPDVYWESKLEACHHVWSNRPATELMVLKKWARCCYSFCSFPKRLSH